MYEKGVYLNRSAFRVGGGGQVDGSAGRMPPHTGQNHSWWQLWVSPQGISPEFPGAG